jgi:hypothetical protein
MHECRFPVRCMNNMLHSVNGLVARFIQNGMSYIYSICEGNLISYCERF